MLLTSKSCNHKLHFLNFNLKINYRYTDGNVRNMFAAAFTCGLQCTNYRLWSAGYLYRDKVLPPSVIHDLLWTEIENWFTAWYCWHIVNKSKLTQWKVLTKVLVLPVKTHFQMPLSKTLYNCNCQRPSTWRQHFCKTGHWLFKYLTSIFLYFYPLTDFTVPSLC